MASALSPTAIAQTTVYSAAPHNLKFDELFPKEILDAVGGPETLEKWGKSPISPEYSANVTHEYFKWMGNTRVKVIKMPEVPALKWGLDKQGRPFIEVLLPGDDPVVFYTYSNCSTPEHFTDLSNWQCNYGGSSAALSVSTALQGRSEKLLAFLAQIGKDPNIQFSYDLFW